MFDLKEKRLILASHNAGKLQELTALIAPFGVTVRSIAEFGYPEPEETGTSFEENAYIKAYDAARRTGLPSLSDDSGLCVAALDEQPGVYSADWAIQADGSRDFAKAMTRLEEMLREKEALLPQQRRAHFVCVICLALPDSAARYFRGEVAGHIIHPPRGLQGFGYDPIFQPEGYDKSFAEMSAQEKHGGKRGAHNPLSHRARAFKQFAEQMFGDG